MKHILQFRKAAIGLLILLLITILTLTIPTKGHAASPEILNLGDKTMTYGVETLTLTADELRAANESNKNASHPGGYIAVSLRYYIALPPGHGLDIAGRGFTIQAGGTYAFRFVNRSDTAAVLFAGAVSSDGRSKHPKHNGVRQPEDYDALISESGQTTKNIFSRHSTMRMTDGTGANPLVANGPFTWAMTILPTTGTGNPVTRGSYIQGDGITTWDTIYIRRLAFVIHDVEEFISRGGFSVIADTLDFAVDNGWGDPSYHRTLMPGGHDASTPIYCRCSKGDINNVLIDWMRREACAQSMNVPAGGVIVITTPQIRMPKTWRPCPTYTIC
jgi:hypothetical protein